MLDAVAPAHVGADTTELLRAALATARVPSATRASFVREECAPYVRCAA